MALAGVDLFRWLGTVATPANGFDFVASAAGNAVQLQAVGSDTNIPINLVPKGTGHLKENGISIKGSIGRQAGLSLFKAQTGRAMAMDNAGNMALTQQVFS